MQHKGIKVGEDYFLGKLDENGKPSGKGTMMYASGDVYKGQLKSGQRHGKGKQITSNNSTFEGDFENDKPHGFGIFIWSSNDYFESYEGQWDMGVPNGTGTIKYTNAS